MSATPLQCCVQDTWLQAGVEQVVQTPSRGEFIDSTMTFSEHEAQQELEWELFVSNIKPAASCTPLASSTPLFVSNHADYSNTSEFYSVNSP